MISIKIYRMFAIANAVVAISSCTDPQEQLDEREVYEGPFIEIEDSEVLYSDSAVVRLMIRAARMQEFEGGDMEYPEGFYVEFYGKEGEMTSKLEADQAFYNNDEDKWRAVGNVKLESIQKHQKLTTEELYWSEKDEQVYTDKFVIIETEEDVLHGEGLTAAQDFSTYRILKPTGELGLD